MRAPIVLTLALAGALNSGGCASMAMAGAAGVAVFAAQERTVGEGIDDAAGSAELKSRLVRLDPNAFARVDVEFSQGVALLTGSVPSEEHRVEAERIAWQIRQVKDVANELEVGPAAGLWRSVRDEAITAQVRARLAADAGVRSIDFNIETVKGVVYLMGLARSDDEIRRAAETASYVSGVERVVVYATARQLPQPGETTTAQAAPTGAGERQ